MSFIIAVFRARSDTMNFASLLRSYGIVCNIINTPRKTSVACGICVSFNVASYNIANSLLSRRHYGSFVGCYRVSGNGYDQQVVPM